MTMEMSKEESQMIIKFQKLAKKLEKIEAKARKIQDMRYANQDEFESVMEQIKKSPLWSDYCTIRRTVTNYEYLTVELDLQKS